MAEAVESGEPIEDTNPIDKYVELVKTSADVRATLDRLLEMKERKFLKENTFVLQGYNAAFYLELDLPSGEIKAHAPPVTGRGGGNRQFEFTLLSHDDWLDTQHFMAELADQLRKREEQNRRLSQRIDTLEADVKALKGVPTRKKKDGED